MNVSEGGQLVEHIFRHEYGKMVSYLVYKFGPSHLERVEDAVQDSLIKAMQVWGYKEPPHNPSAWLMRVAENRLLDILRRDKKMVQKDADFSFVKEHSSPKEVHLSDTIDDSQLKMVFACCHPSLSQDYQIILSLKLIGGFGNAEIAKALLKKEDTVAKSYTRAKRRLKEQIKTLDTPFEIGLQSRLFVVLKVIYLLFSEGYSATSGTLLIKKDICYEAIRLALLLRKNRYCSHPNLEALIALMCFHAARFEARIDEKGELVDLEHQDRSLYNSELIQIGIRHLENSGTSDKNPSSYHLEAAVSYYHCTAKTFGQTDWKSILALYDLRLRTFYSPIVELNRIVPFYKVYGAKEAMKLLRDMEKRPHFTKSALYHAINAELLTHMGKGTKAISALRNAIKLSTNDMEKKHFAKKLNALEHQ